MPFTQPYRATSGHLLREDPRPAVPGARTFGFICDNHKKKPGGTGYRSGKAWSEKIGAASLLAEADRCPKAPRDLGRGLLPLSSSPALPNGIPSPSKQQFNGLTDQERASCAHSASDVMGLGCGRSTLEQGQYLCLFGRQGLSQALHSPPLDTFIPLGISKNHRGRLPTE